MNENILREVAEAYLLPFFPGARIEANARPSSSNQAQVAYVGPCSIAFKAEQNDNYRLVMTRSQAFTLSKNDRIPERKIVEAFVSTISDMKDIVQSKYRYDILPSLPPRVISKSLLNGAHESIILRVIDGLQDWGSRLYEGSNISASIGLRNTLDSGRDIDVSQIFDQDFGAVLSNGHDTMIQVNYKGKFVAHLPINLTQAPPPYCPFRQAAIAEWTTAHERRIGFSLNRLGEILIFQNHMLAFVRRSGKWHFLTHGPTIKQMNVPRNESLRTSIYETCLDVSFARTGGCLGVVQIGSGSAWHDIVSDDDKLPNGTSAKAGSVAKLIAGKRFQELDRRIRQELLAIDGATIISHLGDILAVGAILKIGGGSTGGGRTAAAKALSTFGLGVKISQDGGVTGYRPATDDDGYFAPATDPTFRVM